MNLHPEPASDGNDAPVRIKVPRADPQEQLSMNPVPMNPVPNEPGLT